MAINNNRIVATTAHRDGIKGTPPPVCGEIVPVAPPTPYFSPDGSAYSQPAEYVGQVKFVEIAIDNTVYTMHVVVNLNSSITDGGNFTTSASLAETTDLYDGGNFTTSISQSWTEVILDGDADIPSNQALEWKPCSLFSRQIDSRTGSTYDPLAGFYHPLAN